MGLLQDVLFGDYVARKRREHAVAAAEAMRPEEEFKADVERRLAEGKIKAAEESRIREAAAVEALRRAEIPLNIQARIDALNKYSGDSNFDATDFGVDAARNRAAVAMNKERADYYTGYGQNAARRGARTSALEDLANAGTFSELLGKQPFRYDIGEARGNAERNAANASSAESNKIITTAPVAAAAQVAEDEQRVISADSIGRATRARKDAERLQAELEGQISRYDINNVLPDMLKTRSAEGETKRRLAELNSDTARTVIPKYGDAERSLLLHYPGRFIGEGEAGAGAERTGRSQEIRMVGTGPLAKPEVVTVPGRFGVPTGRRILTPDSGNATPPPPLDWGGKVRPGIGKLPTEGITPVEKPSIDPIEKLQKKEEARLSDVSNWKRSDWLRLAKKSYGLGNIIELNPDRVIVELKKAMSHELSTGRDFVTGAPIPAEVLSQVKQQFEQLQKVQ